jgi:hypothetical protein
MERKILLLPKAKSLEAVFRPLLDKSYEDWLAGGQRVTQTLYAGKYLVQTSRDDNGVVWQFGWCEEEIDLTRPGDFAAKFRTEAVSI